MTFLRSASLISSCLLMEGSAICNSPSILAISASLSRTSMASRAGSGHDLRPVMEAAIRQEVSKFGAQEKRHALLNPACKEITQETSVGFPLLVRTGLSLRVAA